MYGIEVTGGAGSANLYSINKITGACTLIGPTGKATNYAQSMGFDYNDGTLYWCQVAASDDMNFMSVNVTTGEATQIAVTGVETVCFHVPYDIDFCPAVTNVAAFQFGAGAKITWTAPVNTTNLIGYKIYKGTEEVGSVPIGTTTFITDNLASGDYTFAVAAIYDDECTPKKVSTTVTIKICGIAIKGVAVSYEGDDCKATVTWDAISFPEARYNVYMNSNLVAFAIEETYYVCDFVAQGIDVEWCVTQSCPGGGESATGCITKKCGCDKVTDATADVVCDKATITWTAIEGAIGYKVNGELVTTNEYVENGTFENGETYTWTIITVCDEYESEAVPVTGEADCVGINELANTVAIFPNPANGTITIKAANFAKVEVYNTVGQLVETKTVDSFDVSTYSVGVYFFKVYDANNNSVTKRVMVTK